MTEKLCRLRIALTADPELPVPPRLYGGIERVVDMLAQGLIARGHEVSLFAHPSSTSLAKLVPWPGASSNSRIDSFKNSATLTRAVLSGEFDVVHSFSRVGYLTPILPLAIPKLMTYQREINRRSVQLGHYLSRGSLHFSAISKWMMREVQHIGAWHLVFNGVPLDAFDFCRETQPDAPLVFLGRVEEIKGPHLAIEVALRLNLRLVLAGNVPPEHQDWFTKNILPKVDGSQIAYVGPIDDVQKNELLGKARALLMPVLWEEPFGIVMAEAMACGVPVVGFNRGAVPEVVEDGISGYVVRNLSEMVDRVAGISQIDRYACRKRVEHCFSAAAVTEGYISIYREMIADDRQPTMGSR